MATLGTNHIPRPGRLTCFDPRACAPRPSPYHLQYSPLSSDPFPPAQFPNRLSNYTHHHHNFQRQQHQQQPSSKLFFQDHPPSEATTHKPSGTNILQKYRGHESDFMASILNAQVKEDEVLYAFFEMDLSLSQMHMSNHSFCSPGLQKCLILPQSSKIHIQLKAQEERGASEQERLMSKMLRLKWELQQRRWARSIPHQPATTMSEGKCYVLSYCFFFCSLSPFFVSLCIRICYLLCIFLRSFVRSFVRVGQHGLLR